MDIIKIYFTFRESPQDVKDSFWKIYESLRLLIVYIGFFGTAFVVISILINLNRNIVLGYLLATQIYLILGVASALLILYILLKIALKKHMLS
ncbi:hypothetical protein [Brackiella oedipodis]|uniref:hypothetical protein n=1 Tax=Brackiella oedipodis TaxID=124225 RepID=UPI00048BFA86|nr:hypothetical protein [Brackiella oedipodis]